MEYVIALHKVEDRVYLHHWYLLDGYASQKWYENDLKNPKLEKVFTERHPSYETASRRISTKYFYCTGEATAQEKMARKYGIQEEEDMVIENSKI